MISDDRVTKSLQYLATTDENCARARAYFEGLKEQTKTIFSEAFLESDTGSVAEREARARTSQEYKDHLDKLRQAHQDYEIMRNKRLTEEMIIEVWRSEQANRRRGNV